ncbi:MAG: DUF4162 domain-containing protein [Actinobacteria bacterium]|nr:DUF4162 domain-containing protein [Actinomycetota bacterium]MBO0837219.1 DUF4162 domain-containing protein [Actinomycetota bacterium]
MGPHPRPARTARHDCLPRVTGDAESAAKELAREPSVRESSADGQVLRLTVDHVEEALPGLLHALDRVGLTLTSVQLARPTLDDVFLTLTGRSLREESQ